MSKLDLSWVKKALQSGMAFGKKNAPTILTGSSIAIGWAAVYIFWKESRKADAEIKAEEERLAEEESTISIVVDENGEEHREETHPVLPKKEKAFIYLKHCWPALVMGLGSTGCAIWAHEMDLSRLAEMYVLTQFLEDKNADKDDLINKLKSELGVKKTLKAEDELRKEKLPDEEVKKIIPQVPGEGRTLFKDEESGLYFRSEIDVVKDRIRDFNYMAKAKHEKNIKKRFGDAFYSKCDSSPYPDNDIYTSIPVNVFLQFIGETTKDIGFGDATEFRFYTGQNLCVNADDIMEYRDFIDPETGVAQMCYLRYSHLLAPSSILIEQCPF